MDPMDYVMHHHLQPRQPPHYDPVHADSESWANTHSSPMHMWHYPLPDSHPPFAPHLMPSGDPYYVAPNGGGGGGGRLPPPAPNFHGAPAPNHFGGPIPPRLLPISLDEVPSHLVVGSHPPYSPLASNNTANNSTSMSSMSGVRPSSFQPPTATGGGPPGVTESVPPSRPFGYSMGNSHGIPQVNHSHSTAPSSSPPSNITLSRRNHQSAAATGSSNRVNRGDTSPPQRSSPPSSLPRRHYSRLRRPMAARLTPYSYRDEDDDQGPHMLLEHLMAGSMHMEPGMDPAGLEEEFAIRQVQLARGSVSTKMIASKMALRSLQSVKIEDLPEHDRTCVICYNDYGVQTPEGVNEAPLRLPKCKHVFGDHCIKKWFEDSDSCPYCRDKLHSEPKHGTSHSRAFMNIMRMRSVALSQGREGAEDEHLIVRRLTEEATQRAPSGERRSPPDDNEPRRRTRPRHNHSAPYETTSSSSDENRTPPPSETTPYTMMTRLTPESRPRGSQRANPTVVSARRIFLSGGLGARYAHRQTLARGSESASLYRTNPPASPEQSREVQASTTEGVRISSQFEPVLPNPPQSLGGVRLEERNSSEQNTPNPTPLTSLRDFSNMEPTAAGRTSRPW